MVGGEPAVARARRVCATSRQVREEASRTRSTSVSLRATARRTRARAVHLAARAPYARVSGIRAGRPVLIVIRRDGTVDGEEPRSGDPLRSTVTVARGVDRLGAVVLHHAGWRAGIPFLGAVAHVEDVHPQDPFPAPAEPPPFEAQRYWRDLVEGVRLVVVGLDNDGRVAFANPFFFSLTGYDAPEVVGADWFHTFVAPDGKPEIQAVFDQVLGLSGADHHVNPIVTKSGEQRLVAWFNTVRHGSDGAVLGSLSVGEDVTDRVRAEARLRAISEVTQGVLSEQSLGELLGLLARQARLLVGADVASIVLPGDGDALVIAATDGADSDQLEGTVLSRGASISSDVMRMRQGEIVDDASLDPRVCRPILDRLEIGPALFVPLCSAGETLGTLLVANRRGGRRFARSDLEVVESVASHASVALEYRRSQETLQRLVVMEDRDRIARDLHDHIIQRLFATGLSLSAVRTRAQDPVLRDRVAAAIDDLDRTIVDLRASIFELRRREGTGGMREQVLEVVESATGPLGFHPQLRLVGMIDTLTGDDVAHHVVAVIREALSNVARHARAARACVLVAVRDGRLLLEITDDGIGIPVALPRRSGIENLQARAESLGGTFHIGAREDGHAGTVLEWSVPLGAPRLADPETSG
ncbi:MAG: GAF domain-containing protein [Actinomycetota bacterium]|nr:GAF domain-containing protein [Actinomycetota bacterium]